MKTIMILGGGPNQLPLLKAAKKREYQVVLCDYNAENPGREYADIFHCISTLDQDAVIDAALAQKIDGIITNSEPAMKIAAYAAKRLDLPCNPPEIIEKLSRKDQFRALLQKKGFPVPAVRYADTEDQAYTALTALRLPVMVKPVDSSGSRGVTKLVDAAGLHLAFTNAMLFSRVKRVILEEFIESTHDYMIGGDIFVVDGKVIFWGLMNSMRDRAVNPFVPTGTSFPTRLSDEQCMGLKAQTESMISALEIQFGAFNIEMMFGTDGKLYVIELNPRNGGNHIPEILREGTGFDIFDATVAAAVDDQVIQPHGSEPVCLSTYVVHSAEDGILKSVQFSQQLIPHIQYYHEERRQGDHIERFENADKLIGILFLRFDNQTQMEEMLSNISEMAIIALERSM